MLKKPILTMLCLLLAGQSQAQVDPDTILGAWLLDEGQGNVTKDASRNGHDGTLRGSPGWVAGPFGSALQFSGSGTYVDCGNAEALNVKLFSVSFWCNVTAIQGWNHIISRGSHVASGTPGSVNWGVMMYDAQASILFETYNNTGWTGINTNTTVGEWHHLVATYDGDRMQLYHDGTVAATSASGTGILLDPSRRFLIGVRSDAGGQGGYFNGRVDEVGFFRAILSPEGIKTIMNKGLAAVIGGTPEAADPRPANGALDVPRDAALQWTPGMFAATHDVYLGTSPKDVDGASRNSPQGVLVSQGQTDTRYSPKGPLEYGRTYYWRIDEVNKTPDNTVFKGNVWSFTVEPFGYPLKPAKATASSSQAGMGPEKTIDGSGLTGDLHGAEPTTMWLSAGAAPNWIQYEFDKVYKLNDLVVWNSNQLIESFLGFGAKKVTIETSVDGTTWTALANVPEFGRASSTPGYAANTTVSLGVEAKFVKLTITANWGGMAPQTGLAEVRFSYVPVQARSPQPATGTAAVNLDAKLDWRPGREATSHKVFFGTDRAAVVAGTAPKTVATHGFDPGALNFGTSYYWRVDEVGTATYPGSIWTFTTRQYLPIDDFESYTDKAGEEIFTAWVDGFADNYKSSGSTVGLDTAVNGTFAERTIIHGGKQSMPMAYDNTKAPNYSEATRTFDTTQDWTVGAASTLSLWVRGYPAKFVEPVPGQYKISSNTGDVWGTSDNFRFVYKTLTGDGSISAKVIAVTDTTSTWAKAGVMIRNSLDQNSTYAFMFPTPDLRRAFQNRPTTGGSAVSAHSATGVISFPFWVKVERKGNQLTAYYSTDGKTWTIQPATENTGTDRSPNPQTINNMGSNIYVGMAVTSNNAAAQPCVGQFSDVVTTGSVSGQWVVADIGPNTANDPAGMYVTVTDSAGKSVTVAHPDPAAANLNAWTEWKIALSDLKGVNLAKVKKLAVGVGDRASPKAGGTGKVYVDDIQFGGLAAAAAPLGLVAAFSFENDVKDSSANGYDGTMLNAPTFVAGKTGTALKLNGTTDCVDLGMWPVFNFPSSFSLSVWANIGLWNSNWNHVIVGNRGESGIGWQLRRRDSNRIVFTTRGVGQDDEPRSSKDATLNEWVHIAAVYNNAANTKTLYINGVQDAQVTTTPGKLAPTTHNTYIGARANSGNTGVEGRFTGILDEVKIYDIALTPAEVLKLAGK